MEIGTVAEIYSAGLKLSCSFKLTDECSVFLADLLVMFEGAKSIALRELPRSPKIVLYSDSGAALVASGVALSHKPKIGAQLQAVMETNPVQFSHDMNFGSVKLVYTIEPLSSKLVRSREALNGTPL